MKKPWFNEKIIDKTKVYKCDKGMECSVAMCYHATEHEYVSGECCGSPYEECPGCRVVGELEPIPGRKMRAFRPKEVWSKEALDSMKPIR